jgi:hypothetical protein
MPVTVRASFYLNSNMSCILTFKIRRPCAGKELFRVLIAVSCSLFNTAVELEAIYSYLVEAKTQDQIMVRGVWRRFVHGWKVVCRGLLAQALAK